MSLKQFMSHEYDMTHAKRGKAIVINNVVFKNSDDHQAREGSFRDAIKIREILEELRFETVRRRGHDGQLVYEDLTVSQFRELLIDAVNPDLNDYSDCDCFMFIVLSYGIEGAVLCSGPLKDEFIEITEIVDNFKPDSCPSLLMKPKIFLMQLDPAFTIEIADAAVPHEDGVIIKPNVRKVPKEADILLQCCFMSGFYGWLDDDETGLSWYARAMTEGLRRFVLAPMRTHKKSMDFVSVLNRINMIFVKIMDEEGLTPDRQIGGPQTTSTLTKRMIFTVKPTDTIG
ncbi:hypothetical protein FSP39_024065 [Pinctada imbricata]|uniref:Caspase family p20 domain-containing protein n=1 Tax=Pinctada imbricata TaxID=66713 RepID=A0AA89C781_PINIB|nr:hypothetical protein FSP39_024065 [Pinctada imbricata]